MEKTPILEESYFISAGDSNARGEVSLPILTARLIDIATKHANLLEIGNPMMTDINGGWVLARLTFDFDYYPKVNTFFSVQTWIESFNKHFSVRCFRFIDEEGNTAGYARSIWMIMSITTHENLGLSHFSLPSEWILGEDAPIEKQSRHNMDHDLSLYADKLHNPSDNLLICLKHDFTYSDLDAYKHVNTIRYVALLIDQWPLEVHLKSMVKRLEIAFAHEVSPGKTTLLLEKKLPNENSSEFTLLYEEESKVLMTAKISLKNEK